MENNEPNIKTFWSNPKRKYSIFDEPIVVEGREVSHPRPVPLEPSEEFEEFHERIRIRSLWESDY